MNTYNRDEYWKQLKVVLLELKKLKQIKGISGDMDISDELRIVNEFLIASSYDWEIIIEPLMAILKNYVFYADIPVEQKEKIWDLVATFIKVITHLSKYSLYVNTSQTFFEEIVTEIDNGKLLNK